MRCVIISAYALKSRRKNAKCEMKEFHAYPDSRKLKHRFTGNDFADLQQWCTYMVDTVGYPFFQFTVTDGLDILSDGTNIWKRVHGFREEPFESSIVFCETVKVFFDLYNIYYTLCSRNNMETSQRFWLEDAAGHPCHLLVSHHHSVYIRVVIFQKM